MVMKGDTRNLDYSSSDNNARGVLVLGYRASGLGFKMK